MGNLTSQSGEQQGDPIGPFLFALVLNKVAGAFKEDTECSQLSLIPGMVPPRALSVPSVLPTVWTLLATMH